MGLTSIWERAQRKQLQRGRPSEKPESLLHKPSVSYTQNRPIRFLHCHLSEVLTAQAATLDVSCGEPNRTTVYNLTFAIQE